MIEGMRFVCEGGKVDGEGRRMRRDEYSKVNLEVTLVDYQPPFRILLERCNLDFKVLSMVPSPSI